MNEQSYEVVGLADLRRGDRVYRIGLSGPRWLTVCEVRLENAADWPVDVARVVFAEDMSVRYLTGSTFRRAVR